MPIGRRERNQQLFRAVNQRIGEIGATLQINGAEDRLDFICECANASCVGLVSLTLAEYERVPRASGYFLVKPGHEARHQRVVARTGHYVVIDDRALDGSGVSAGSGVEASEAANVDA